MLELLFFQAVKKLCVFNCLLIIKPHFAEFESLSHAIGVTLRVVYLRDIPVLKHTRRLIRSARLFNDLTDKSLLRLAAGLTVLCRRLCRAFCAGLRLILLLPVFFKRPVDGSVNTYLTAAQKRADYRAAGELFRCCPRVKYGVRVIRVN